MRHPGYAGGLALTLATPFLLGSWPALIPAVVLVAILIVRTILEDRTLRREFSGYVEYVCRVRYRLLPGDLVSIMRLVAGPSSRFDRGVAGDHANAGHGGPQG